MPLMHLLHLYHILLKGRHFVSVIQKSIDVVGVGHRGIRVGGEGWLIPRMALPCWMTHPYVTCLIKPMTIFHFRLIGYYNRFQCLTPSPLIILLWTRQTMNEIETAHLFSSTDWKVFKNRTCTNYQNLVKSRFLGFKFNSSLTKRAEGLSGSHYIFFFSFRIHLFLLLLRLYNLGRWSGPPQKLQQSDIPAVCGLPQRPQEPPGLPLPCLWP